MKTARTTLGELIAIMRGLPESTQDLLKTVFLGVAAALAAVAFLLLTNYVFRMTFLTFASRSLTYFLAGSFCVIMTTSLAVGLLLNRLSPDAAGSGIPQLKAAYWKEVGYVHLRPVVVKFIAGVLSLGGGTSLGREGPTVYIGGGLASVLSGYLGYPKRLRRGAMVIGASAGLAAAFNTPLAAITFVLEEIITDINSRIIGRVVLSSVLGAFVVYAIVGRQPAFILPSIEAVSWKVYAVYPLVAMVASLAGVVFHRFSLDFREQLKGLSAVPPWFLPCCGGFITWVIGAGCFILTGKVGIFGLGYHDLSEALSHGLVWWVAGILLAGKLVAFIASYSFGGCGGIFSP
ncbi:MAG TPA: chloride channel protein, partial [Deltaproteobacteria bacterium]|nr:chloride channel protein [Deltaproteobacteria bacterium]